MPLNWRVWCVGVCLPVCGHGRGNGARLREMADSRVLATARHIHICLRVAVLHDSSHFRRFRPAAAPTVTALGTSGRVRRGARGLGLSPAPCAAAPVVFAAIRAAILRRRIRLLALRRVSPRIRRTASSHVAQFGTRPLVPCLTFHKVHFSFAASALADVPSARLILPVADVSRFRPRHNLISLCLILAWQFRYNMPNAVENEESERKHQNGR